MSELALFPEEPPKPRTGPERHLARIGMQIPAMSMQLESERIAKEEGQRLALQAARDTYKRRFEMSVKYFTQANTPTPFTVDDVIAMIGLPPFNGKNTSNAVGALMAGLAKGGLIRSIGWQESTRKGNHARPVRVWIGAAK